MVCCKCPEFSLLYSILQPTSLLGLQCRYQFSPFKVTEGDPYSRILLIPDRLLCSHQAEALCLALLVTDPVASSLLWVGGNSSFCGAVCRGFTIVILMGTPLTLCCTLLYCRMEGLKVRTMGSSFKVGVSCFGCVLSFIMILLLLLEKTVCTGRMAGLFAEVDVWSLVLCGGEPCCSSSP